MLEDDVLRSLGKTRGVLVSVERIVQEVPIGQTDDQGFGGPRDREQVRRMRTVLRRLQRQGFVRRVLVGGWQITEAGLGRLRGLEE